MKLIYSIFLISSGGDCYYDCGTSCVDPDTVTYVTDCNECPICWREERTNERK